MNQEQIDKARRDFEIGLVFHVGEMFPGGEHAGCLKRDDDGIYKMEHIEAAWRGYLMAKKQENAQLTRFNSDRYISMGMCTEFTKMTGAVYSHPGVIPSMFKAALIIAGDTPS